MDVQYESLNDEESLLGLILLLFHLQSQEEKNEFPLKVHLILASVLGLRCTVEDYTNKPKKKREESVYSNHTSNTQHID